MKHFVRRRGYVAVYESKQQQAIYLGKKCQGEEMREQHELIILSESETARERHFGIRITLWTSTEQIFQTSGDVATQTMCVAIFPHLSF